MSAVTNTTGDITSILFGVPGEPTTAATIIDGHAMAKKGEAGRALGAAMFIWALWQSRHFDFRSGLFPWAIGFPVLVLIMIQIVRDLTVTEEESSGDAGGDLPVDVVKRRTQAIFIWIFIYFAAI